MAVQILKADLTEKVNAGWKKNQLAEHYGLPMTQMTKVLQQAGLRIKKLHYPKFELLDEEPVVNDLEVQEAQEVTQEVPVEEAAVQNLDWN